MRWRNSLSAPSCSIRIGTIARVCLLSLASMGPAAAQHQLYVVRGGRPAAVIRCGTEDRAAAVRLHRRIQEWTAASLSIEEAGAGRDVAEDLSLVLVGSPRSHAGLREILGHRDLQKELGEEGFVIRTTAFSNHPTLLLAGATRLGAIFAAGEFLNWHLHIDGKDAWVEQTDLVLCPAMQKRMMWSSVGGANWAPDFERFLARQSPAAMAHAITDETSYLHHTRWLTDFMVEHKFNGLIFWGFAGSATGGVEPARKMSRYAKENGVRILPLIGTGIYAGFFHGEHELNITTFAKKHPEARCQKMDGTPYEESLAPCHPAATTYFREGAEWLFNTFPDIGGVNLENGDWMSCWNEDCSAAKARPENDPNFYWDMMASQRDIIEIGLKHQPDAWMTFATYTPFTESLIRRDLAKAMQQKLAEAVAYPPRFLDQVDPRSIAQWTVSGMNSTYLWPDSAAPPPGRLKHHIAFTHANSYYGQKYDAARWWAEPNATYDDSSPILFFQIPQAIKTGFEGYVVKGFVGDVSPANELFYLAAEELLWNPASTPQQFVERRLSRAYGGVERAELFLKLLRKTTRETVEILADQATARGHAEATSGDPRISRRWRNLAAELGRRAGLAQATRPANQ